MYMAYACLYRTVLGMVEVTIIEGGMNELLEMRCDIVLFINVFTKRAFVLCDYIRVFLV